MSSSDTAAATRKQPLKKTMSAKIVKGLSVTNVQYSRTYRHENMSYADDVKKISLESSTIKVIGKLIKNSRRRGVRRKTSVFSDSFGIKKWVVLTTSPPLSKII